MAVKITLDGVSISGNSKLLTNSSIKSCNADVDVKLKNTTLSDGVAILDSTQIEETQNQHLGPKSKDAGGNKLAKGVGAFVKDVVKEAMATALSDKINGQF